MTEHHQQQRAAMERPRTSWPPSQTLPLCLRSGVGRVPRPGADDEEKIRAARDLIFGKSTTTFSAMTEHHQQHRVTMERPRASWPPSQTLPLCHRSGVGRVPRPGVSHRRTVKNQAKETMETIETLKTIISRGGGLLSVPIGLLVPVGTRRTPRPTRNLEAGTRNSELDHKSVNDSLLLGT